MNKYLLVSVLILMLNIACVKTQTKNTEQEVAPQSSQTLPTPIQISSELRVSNLDFSKAEKISFSRLPREIIAHLAQYENRAEYIDKDDELQSYPDSSPKWYEGKFVEVLARDINNDGVMEKVVICDDSADYDVEPTAYFFILNNKRWASLHSGGFGSPKKLELFSSEKKDEFDIIGYSGERKDTNGKIIKFTGYWRVENGQYEKFECRELKENIERTVPCQK